MPPRVPSPVTRFYFAVRLHEKVSTEDVSSALKESLQRDEARPLGFLYYRLLLLLKTKQNLIFMMAISSSVSLTISTNTHTHTRKFSLRTMSDF